MDLQHGVDRTAEPGANLAVNGRGDVARIGVMLQGLVMVVGVILVLVGSSSGSILILLIGVAGAYVARNPLRHVAAVVAAAAVLCVFAPVAAASAGAVFYPDSILMEVAITGPRVGAAALVVISAIGLVLQLRRRAGAGRSANKRIQLTRKR